MASRTPERKGPDDSIRKLIREKLLQRQRLMRKPVFARRVFLDLPREEVSYRFFMILDKWITL